MKINWLKMKRHLPLLHMREAELEEFVFENGTDHVARIGSFEKAGAARLEQADLQRLFLSRLEPFISNKQISVAEADDMARFAADQALQAFSKEPSGSLSHKEMEAGFLTILNLEKSLRTRVEALPIPAPTPYVIENDPIPPAVQEPEPVPMSAPVTPKQTSEGVPEPAASLVNEAQSVALVYAEPTPKPTPVPIAATPTRTTVSSSELPSRSATPEPAD